MSIIRSHIKLEIQCYFGSSAGEVVIKDGRLCVETSLPPGIPGDGFLQSVKIEDLPAEIQEQAQAFVQKVGLTP